MAVYNAEKYLKESIDSILNQTFSNFELIIINDGSTDTSLEIIKSYDDKRIVLIDKENSGVAKARNFGIKIARGDYVAVQDSDDISFSTRLEKQYDFLNEHTDCVAVGSNTEIIDEHGNFVCYSDVCASDNEIKSTIHPSSMFRRSALNSAGLYPEYMFNIAEDRVLFHKLTEFGNVENILESLLQYRIVPNSCTKRSNVVETELNEIISKAIKDDEISDDDITYLRNRFKECNSKNTNANYHLYLAKKYLWDNYQPRLARMNLIRSLKLKPLFLQIYFYLGLSLLPEGMIRNVYNFKK